MFISHVIDIEGKAIGENGFKQALIGPKQGWEGYVMRLITRRNKTSSPLHTHPWPHINYFISGEGILVMDKKEYPVESGPVAYVPENMEHQFRSLTEEDFTFICIVSEQGDK